MKRSEKYRNHKRLLRLSVAVVVAIVAVMSVAGCHGNTYWHRSGPVRCGGTSSRCFYYASWSREDLYANATNTIRFYYDSDHPFDSVVVAVSHGTATKGKRPECRVHVPDSMIGRTVTVYSLVRSGKVYDTLSRHDYREMRLPDPELVLGLFHSGIYSPEVILKDSVVRAYDFGDDYTVEWEVVSYRVTLTDKEGAVLAEMDCRGNTLPEEVRAAVRKAPAYSELRFREVVTRSGEEERELEGFALYVDFEE